MSAATAKKPEPVTDRIVISTEEWMIGEIVELLKGQYLEDSERQKFQFKEPRVENMVALSVFRPEVFCGFAAVDMGTREIVGVFIGALTANFYSEDPIAGDVAVYVRPEYRDDVELLGRMIASFESWAKKLGVKHLQMSEAWAVVDGWTELSSVKIVKEID